VLGQGRGEDEGQNFTLLSTAVVGDKLVLPAPALPEKDPPLDEPLRDLQKRRFAR